MGKEGELHGHLKLDNIKHVGLVSKAFMVVEIITSVSSIMKQARTF